MTKSIAKTFHRANIEVIIYHVSLYKLRHGIIIIKSFQNLIDYQREKKM